MSGGVRASPEDPARIGRYRLVARLGAGGMGVVYLGRSRQHGQVAIKVPRPEYADDPDFRARFRREVLALGRVQGACTVRVIESDAESARPFLVTEYASGPSLSEHVDASGPLDADMLHGLAMGLAEALAAIHRADVVHRDLKPSNVLLTATGPKVIDFGIAQALDLSRLTRINGAIGTPGYMAPEQFTGSSGPATDIFAWGLTIAFAASGQPPFGSGPIEVLPHRIQNENPDINAVPEPLRGLVAAALAKDPAVRPTALDLLWSLGLRPDQPVQTTTKVLLSRTWRMPPPTKVYTPPARASAAPRVATPRPSATPAASRVPASLRSRRTVLIAAAATAAALTAGAVAALAANSPPGHSAASSGTRAISTRSTSAPPVSPTPSATPRSPTPSATRTPSLSQANITPAAIPALAGLDDGQQPAVAGLACTSPGNCTVIGTYNTTSGTQTDAMFVADEINGTWSAAAEPPGASTFEGQSITVNAMSCASAGNCVAGGQYDPSYNDNLELPFVVSETSGAWHTPKALTGLGSQVTQAQVTSVSCPSAGNCTVTGYANPGTFVADEVNGVWGAAHLLPVLDTTGGSYSGATLVSCATAGNCVVAAESYVYTERDGTWDGGQAIPGSPGPVTALSCAPDGGCSVGGSGGVDSSGDASANISQQAWIASQTSGSWTMAAVLPGLIPLDGGDSAQITALACTNGGNCDLLGSGSTPEENPVVFTEREISGTWKTVQDESAAGEMNALSCSSAGNCGAVGDNNTNMLFETAGTWNVITPGNSDSGMTIGTAAISCPTSNWCAIATTDNEGDLSVAGGSPS